MTHNIGDGPIEEQFNKMMIDLARFLDRAFNGELRGKNRHTGFLLMVFPFSDDGETTGGHRANYISNADRKDVVTLLKEQVAHFEGQPNLEGHA